jgi:hypothetical protein
VSRPLFLLVDTATGLVMERPVMGSREFRPVTNEPAPGAALDSFVPGRYDVSVVPGRRGSGLLRLDTVTGETWFYQLGANQGKWDALPRALADSSAPKNRVVVGKAAPRETPVANSAKARRAATSLKIERSDASEKPPVEPMIEVLTQPGFDPELQLWTAEYMAHTHPVRASELLSIKLMDSDPRVIVAIIENVTLDAEGRVRAALEKLQGHADPGVAEALSAKLK